MKRQILQILTSRKSFYAATWSALALVMLFGGMAGSGHAGSEPIATVQVYSSEIVFVPIGEAGNHMLTVSGNNGVYFQEEFSPGENPSFPLPGEGGFAPDGRYRYELRTQPEIDRKALEEAEEAGDDRLMEAIARAEQAMVKIQTGTFEIAEGKVVLPEEDGEDVQEDE